MMKTKICSMLALAAMLSLASCGDKYYPTEIIREEGNGAVGAETQAVMYEVAKADWKWNAKLFQYEVAIKEQISDEVFGDGLIYSSIYFVDNGEDVQSPLPYTQNFKDASGNPYMLTITSEIQFNSVESTIYFSLKTSDIESAKYHLDDYDMKLVYVWPSLTRVSLTLPEGYTKLNETK